MREQEHTMTRTEAIEKCKNLYGLDIEFVYEVVCELGYDAFTDDAIRLLAELQHQYELNLINELNNN